MHTSPPTLLGRGLYTLAEASRISGVPRKSIVRWTEGYDFPYRGETHHSDGIIGRTLDQIENQRAFEFLDLLEARFLHAFRKRGVSLQTLRLAAQRAKELIHTTHPFSTKKFRTDGRTILLEIINEGIEDPILLDIVRNQFALREVLSDYLYDGIVWGENDEPLKWFPLEHKKTVVIDPQRSFGAPIISRKGIMTKRVYRSYRVEQSITEVARWFELEKNEVEDAVTYEQKLAA